jgi:Na+-transporting NADH:ubiquinone oxidoreductase subunit A
MKTIHIKKGLDIPMAGPPEQTVRPAPLVKRVALVGDDYVGLRPTMLVQEGERVALGQPVFTDKKNPGFNFTAPGCGKVAAIHRGPKRRFEALIIDLDGDDELRFPHLGDRRPADVPAEEIRSTLQDSGLWTALRKRPYGTIPAVDSAPSSLFVTAIDTNPLAPDPAVILAADLKLFAAGLEILCRLVDCPVHLCVGQGVQPPESLPARVECWMFTGPHPAGLPSTHIHCIDPVHSDKQVWHIDYQDVIAIGHLFQTGCLLSERTISIAGVGVKGPALYRARQGGALTELTAGLIDGNTLLRVVSGSILHGRKHNETTGFLGRYHRQISVLPEDSGRALFGWMRPGSDRFSSTRMFLSAFLPRKLMSLPTALWGGERAIYPLGGYEKVMPLDIIATSLLKSLAVGDIEKSAALGCLELVEEDLALCTFVCPGKNEFGPMLRTVLATIEKEGL